MQDLTEGVLFLRLPPTINLAPNLAYQNLYESLQSSQENLANI